MASNVSQAEISDSAGIPQSTVETSPRNEGESIAVYDGQSVELVRIAAVNALLAFLTLGIHRFWGGTSLRRYFGNRIAIHGERLEYAGKASEAALRFAVGASVIVILLALLWEAIEGIYSKPVQLTALKLMLVICLPLLFFFAQFRGRRYHLSQTQWRNLRFSQHGSAWIYALQATGLSLAVVLTAGLAYPYMQSRLQHYRINNTCLGDRQFTFSGSSGELFRQWVPALVLAIPTLGLSVLWYKVVEFRYVTSRIRLGKLEFSSALPVKDTVFLSIKFIVYAVVLSLVSALVVLGSAGAILALLNIGSEIPPPPRAIAVQIQIVVGVSVFCLFLASLLRLLYTVVLLHPIIDAVCKTLTTRGTNDLNSIAPGETAQIIEAKVSPYTVWTNAP